MKRQIRNLLCKIGRHKWHEFKRTNQLIYFLRTCEHCARLELKNAGPMGDGKYQNIYTMEWRQKWEQEDFEKSIIC